MSSEKWIIGVDEAGRGPLAGPVCVACFAVKENLLPKINNLDLKDSKQLSRVNREKWHSWISDNQEKRKIAKSFSFTGPERIDRVGIVNSIEEALYRAISRLDINPSRTIVLLDGLLKAPAKFINQDTIIRGDEKNKIIALASIIAKVERDRLMLHRALKFEGYGFEKNMGYGTRDHLKAIKKRGLTSIHRRSFCSRALL